MSAVKCTTGLVGAVVALLVGILVVPAAAAPADAGPAPLADAGCVLEPPDWGADAFYDESTGALTDVRGVWQVRFLCQSPPGGSALRELFFASDLMLNGFPVSFGSVTECDLAEGDTICDFGFSGSTPAYFCEEGPFECAGDYTLRVTVHTALSPGMVWGEIPDYCEEVAPPPAQVVDCLFDTEPINVPPFQGGA